MSGTLCRNSLEGPSILLLFVVDWLDAGILGEVNALLDLYDGGGRSLECDCEGISLTGRHFALRHTGHRSLEEQASIGIHPRRYDS